MIRKLFTLHLNLFYPRVFLASDNYIRSLQAVLSNGFAFCLMWNVLENGYLEPHANTRIDFHRERGKVRHEVVNLLNSSQIILIRILKI